MDNNTIPAPDVRTQPTLEEKLALADIVIAQLIAERQASATGDIVPVDGDTPEE